jgi:hypothetical protein
VYQWKRDGVRAAPPAKEHERIARWADDPDAMLDEVRAVEEERIASGRRWAAIVLALDLPTCRAVLRGDPVLAERLDAVVLRRSLRGAALPPAERFIDVTISMLDGVAEAGRLVPVSDRGRE